MSHGKHDDDTPLSYVNSEHSKAKDQRDHPFQQLNDSRYKEGILVSTTNSVSTVVPESDNFYTKTDEWAGQSPRRHD